MKNKNISTPLETGWDRLDKMTDEEIDFEPVLYGEMYVSLRDVVLFNQVRLSEDSFES